MMTMTEAAGGTTTRPRSADGVSPSGLCIPTGVAPFTPVMSCLAVRPVHPPHSVLFLTGKDLSVDAHACTGGHRRDCSRGHVEDPDGQATDGPAGPIPLDWSE